MWQTDWTFGLIGGLMIGLAGALLLAVNGRIMGASGILGGLLDGTGRSNLGERITFLAALVAAPGLVALLGTPDAETHLTDNLPILILGGLLVGVGVKIGNGCTSGHGVCGMSRLSVRSIVATVVYLVAGALTLLLARHGLGLV